MTEPRILSRDERARLVAMLREVAIAEARVEETAEPLRAKLKPIDDALLALDGLRTFCAESFGTEIIGQCEACESGEDVLFAGELGCRSGEDGIVLCETHAPTGADAIAQIEQMYLRSEIKNDEFSERRAEIMQTCGGDLAAKMVWPL